MNNEKRIQEALDGLKKGQYSSLRAAAKAHTLHWIGEPTERNPLQNHKKAIAEEKALLRWITQMTAAEHPVRHGYIYEMAHQCHFGANNFQQVS